MTGDFLLHTERVVLRRFKQTDLETFQAYRADPAVAIYQGWGAGFSRQDAQRFIDRVSQRSPGALGTGVQIAIELRSSGMMRG